MAILYTIGLWVFEAVALLFAAAQGWISADTFGQVGVACMIGTPFVAVWARWSEKRAAAEAQHRFIASAVSRGIQSADEKLRVTRDR